MASFTDSSLANSLPDHFEGILAKEACRTGSPLGPTMSVVENRVDSELEDLARAVKSWVEAADGRPLFRWLSRELDADGAPIRLAVPDWHRCLEILAAARRRAGDWPNGCDDTVAGLVRATLRFARPDGSPTMQPDEGSTRRIPPAWVSLDWMDWYRGTRHRAGAGLVVWPQVQVGRGGSSSAAHLVGDGSGTGDAPSRLATGRRLPGRRPPRPPFTVSVRAVRQRAELAGP